MSSIHDALNDLAAEGEREYSAVESPSGYDAAFVGGVRQSRRRRQALSTVAAVAVVGVGAAIGMSLGKAEPAPAAAPGEELWHANLGSESWSSPAFVDGLLIAGTDNGAGTRAHPGPRPTNRAGAAVSESDPRAFGPPEGSTRCNSTSELAN